MSAPPQITFAIGDIHGHLDKLKVVIEACRRYAAGRSSRFITLGDYIDRGPDSKGVVHYLRDWTGPENMVCLKGNHEDMLVAALETPHESASTWLTNGGQQTLWSYGINYPHEIPYADSGWMNDLPFCYDDGLRLFVHAGIDPTISLSEQTEGVMLYSRKTYPDDIDPGRYIVHGHTPQRVDNPVVHPHRINLDTSAANGGPLSAAVFSPYQTPPVALIVDDRIIALPAAPFMPVEEGFKI